MHPQPENDRDFDLPVEDTVAETLRAEGLTPGRKPALVRLPLRRRNQICICIIAAGLANFLVYTISYALIGGDAYNGYRDRGVDARGRPVSHFFVRGHFIHSLSGKPTEVSRATWIYSFVHSISVPLTSGALVLSMLVLARPHILATMRGGRVSGRTLVLGFGAVVVVFTLATTIIFTVNFVQALE